MVGLPGGVPGGGWASPETVSKVLVTGDHCMGQNPDAVSLRLYQISIL
jgi:hypothetical protein